MSGRSTGRQPLEPESRRAARDAPRQVSVLAVPALLGALVLCAVSGYILGPLALLVLGLVVAGALTAVVRWPEHREAAVAAVIGGALGLGGVMVIALLHYLG